MTNYHMSYSRVRGNKLVSLVPDVTVAELLLEIDISEQCNLAVEYLDIGQKSFKSCKQYALNPKNSSSISTIHFTLSLSSADKSYTEIISIRE